MVSAPCNQKNIKEFSEYHDSHCKFISMQEFNHCVVKFDSLGRSQGSMTGKLVESGQVRMVGAIQILKMAGTGDWSSRERRKHQRFLNRGRTRSTQSYRESPGSAVEDGL